MDPLDPAVLAATGQAPGLDEPPDGSLVTAIDEDTNDPAWSRVTFADGRVENRPTAEALALPKAPPEAPMGPPPPPAPVGAGNPPSPGFELTPEQQAMTSATPETTLPSGGAFSYGSGVETPTGVNLELAPATPGVLPAPQVDPGAAVVSGEGAPPGGPTRTSVSETENQTVADPAAVAQNTLDTANRAADALDEQARGQQTAARVENQANLEANEARQREVEEDLRRAEIYTEEAQRVLQVVEDTPIEQDFYKDAPGRQVAAWVALALSGFLQGATKGANPALNQMMQAISHAQDRFIENQKANKNSKLALRTKALGDARVAEASMRMQLAKLYEDGAKLQARQYGLEALPPAISATGAQMRVRAAESAQQVGMFVQGRTERRFEQERQAGPQFQGDRDLAALGVDRKAHADAMDSRGGNLGGMVQGAQRLARIQQELEAIAKRNGGQLPSQDTLSYSTFGAAGLAARLGSDSGKDQVRTKQLMEEAKLAFKQTINIKSVDSENEGKNFNAMMDSGETETTLQALRDKVAETNQRAVATASGYSRNPQGYLQFVERTLSSNPGVQGAGAAPARGGIPGEEVVAPPPPPAGDAGGAEGPARPPLAPLAAKAPEANLETGSRRGTYRRLRESKPGVPR